MKVNHGCFISLSALGRQADMESEGKRKDVNMTFSFARIRKTLCVVSFNISRQKSVLVKWGIFFIATVKKLTQHWWLQTTQIYYFTILHVRSPTWILLAKIKVSTQLCFSMETPENTWFPWFFRLLEEFLCCGWL